MRTYRTVSLNALWFLIALNVVIFVITRLRPEGMILTFGLTPAYLPKQPWTILTAMFVHYDFFHILFNMISLYFLGSFFLRAAGERNFLEVFFIGGLAGNLLYFLLGYLVYLGKVPAALGNPFSTGIGASGAVFAIGGALAVLVPRVRVMVFPVPIPMPLWVAIIILLVLSFFFAGIAWQAHLGGVAAGAIMGYLLRRRGRYYHF
jgi:membrane associated rhomboid family serine protease